LLCRISPGTQLCFERSRMRGSLRFTASVLLVALILAVVSSSGFCQKKGEKLPEFFVRQKAVNLGDFYEGTDIKYSFTVYNRGSGELHIENVRPG